MTKHSEYFFFQKIKFPLSSSTKLITYLLMDITQYHLRLGIKHLLFFLIFFMIKVFCWGCLILLAKAVYRNYFDSPCKRTRNLTHFILNNDHMIEDNHIINGPLLFFKLLFEKTWYSQRFLLIKEAFENKRK